MLSHKQIELNHIYNESCLDTMARIDDNFIDIIITSPPYNVGKNYGDFYDDCKSTDEYFRLITDVARETLRITRIGGRLCLNVPLVGNSYFATKSSHLQFYPLPYIEIFTNAGWIFRDFVIWIKTNRAEDPNMFCGDSTQWGSWMSPSCPYLRCFSEAILIFHKQQKTLLPRDNYKKTDITKDEFLEYTKNVWYFPSETNREHPAPFPVELPLRCIKLYSWKDSIIYDPFAGSGTTVIAALRTERQYIASEINPFYVKMALKRIDYEQVLMSQLTIFES